MYLRIKSASIGKLYILFTYMFILYPTGQSFISLAYYQIRHYQDFLFVSSC